MKIILKNTQRYTLIVPLCLIVATLFAIKGCSNSETKHHILKFAGEGIEIESQSIEYGNYATEPKNPEREGFGFEGWFIDDDTFANEWDFNTYVVTQDTTLYANWGINYPIDVPFTEFSLTGTSCQWTTINYDDTLIVINTDFHINK